MKKILTKSEIFDIVSVLKALAITLVVFLHLEVAKYNEYFIWFNNFIRPFRMPVFMFASGFLYFYVSKNKYPQYSLFAFEKFKRLIVPMIFIKVAYNLMKVIIGFSYSAFNSYSIPYFEYKTFLRNMFLYPGEDTTAIHLWFVYALFLIFLIARIFKNKIYLLALCSLIIHFIPLPNIFALNYVRIYLLFFCMGCLAKKFYSQNNVKMSLKLTWLAIIGGVFISILLWIIGSKIEEIVSVNSFLKNVVGIVVMTSIAILLAQNRKSWISKNLIFVGSYSSSIYFLHTFSYRITELLIQGICKVNPESYFWVITTVLLILSIYIPILLDKYFISKSRIAGFLVLGRRYNFTFLKNV